MIGSPVHVLAIVKGAVEGDPFKHFGSILGYQQHLAHAVRLGLVDELSEPTPLGRSFYANAQLADLSDGRANHWWGTKTEHACEMLANLEPLEPRP